MTRCVSTCSSRRLNGAAAVDAPAALQDALEGGSERFGAIIRGDLAAVDVAHPFADVADRHRHHR